MYLRNFSLPGDTFERNFMEHDAEAQRTCYPSFYPFGIFCERGLRELEFAPITCFYGGNGSGKTTLLNLIAETYRFRRGAPFNQTSFFERYVARCREIQPRQGSLPSASSILTSDDVFQYLLETRRENDAAEQKRLALLEQYRETKYTAFQMSSLEEYDRLKEYNAIQRNTASGYVKRRVKAAEKESSNGQCAFRFFTEQIQEAGVYLLDEPENSLSVERQIELSRFLEDSARFFGCQFILSTHSPFLLAMEGAKVYDLDVIPIRERKWTELENVRRQFDFFAAHAEQFRCDKR